MARKRSTKKLVSAREQSIDALFSTESFALDYYQREYVWDEPQVARLMNDLSRKFLDQWSDEHSLADVKSYDPYFLGPYIICTADGRTSLVDGQQRIITLLLLLIYLHRQAAATPKASSRAGKLLTLIMSERFGRRTFRVDVDEYGACFNALLNERGFDVATARPSIRRIWQAYQYIDIHYPAQLRGDVLVMFIDWLLYRVSLVVMDAGDRDRAEEMFQSINDCGVRLSPMDHLKRFLLSDAEADPRELEGAWTTMVSALEDVERGAAFAYLRTVFRARFPEAAHKPGPSLNDATHEWVRAHEAEIWPNRKNGDRVRLITEVLYPFHTTYATLLQARSRINPHLRAVRYNTFNGIAEQFDLTLAALRSGDSETERAQKAGLVANFLDLFYVTQTLGDEPVEQRHIDELVSAVMPAVRLSESVQELSRALGEHAADWPVRLQLIPDLRYDTKRRFVHYVLTRLTAWVEMGATNGEADPTDRFLLHRDRDRNFEIEHLFTSTASKYAHKAPDARYYGFLRNRIGALLLLDGLDNGSYGGMLLEKKLASYRKDTLLAGMLNPDFFQRGNVRLRKFLTGEGLYGMIATYDASTALEPFIEARGRFYCEIAKKIWSLDALGLAPLPAPGPLAPGKRTRYGVRFQDLVEAGLVSVGARLVGRRRGELYYARVRPGGSIETASGVASAPTKAMEDVVGVASNGWAFWEVEGTKERLDTIRQRYLEQAAR
ncbi:GmrSD restriction endonuclease domain-containing protein [Micromonospora ureilytica]|uniref:GmrSD restriction endonuclease domain-containing protein n=1 Tax=Micromonospora ureilytica TaxID=709868 RepID=UPI004039E450